MCNSRYIALMLVSHSNIFFCYFLSCGGRGIEWQKMLQYIPFSKHVALHSQLLDIFYYIVVRGDKP
jgi:hypothetical protein